MGGIYSKEEEIPAQRSISLKRKNIVYDEPLAKRYRSTFNYLFENLFLLGEGSDVCIKAFDYDWNLHKLYIQQSPFFASMFSGAWAERDLKKIQLEFTDFNINKESLNIVFGSFYNNQININNDNVISILATGLWFQLSDITEQCEMYILENICLENSIQYFEVAESYGMTQLADKVLIWICRCIMITEDCDQFFEILKSISPLLLLKIIKNPNLFVIQVEEDILLLLLKWLYLQKVPNPLKYGDALITDVRNYFRRTDIKIDNFNQPDLVMQLFEQIKWPSILSTYSTAISVLKFSIIPKRLLQQSFQNQWLSMLYQEELVSNNNGRGDNNNSNNNNDNNSDNNNSNDNQIQDNFTIIKTTENPVFWKYCERYGRVLSSNTNTTWRWAGFSYKADLIIKYCQRTHEIFLINYQNSEQRYRRSSYLLFPTQNSNVNTPQGSTSSPVRVQIRAVIAQYKWQNMRTVNSSLPFNNSAKNKRHNHKNQYPIFGDVIDSGILNLQLFINKPVKLLQLPADWLFPIVFVSNILKFDPIPFHDYTASTSENDE